MKDMRKAGVVLLSGGLDSTTVAAYALKQGYELWAITLDYGQKHHKELESARRVSGILGIKHEVIDISFFGKLAWYSALTEPGRFDLPGGRTAGEMAASIPLTYVPLRNTLFLVIAAAFLESEVLHLIEREGIAPAEIEAHIFIAANAIDYSGYPDCRPEYFRKMAGVLFDGSKLGSQYKNQINIETPLISMSKAEIVRIAMDLQAPLEYTWSCYRGEAAPCGQCDSCILRAKGFTEAGYQDPLIVRLRGEGRGAQG
jgi:7-cyano-7-deazaguanine synthase